MTTARQPSRSAEGKGRRDGAGKLTLYFFQSPRSGPSRRAEAVLANVLQRHRSLRKIAVQRIDCDERPDLAERYAVTKLPTLIVIDGRKALRRLEGSCGCRQVEELLQPWLNGHADPESTESGDAMRSEVDRGSGTVSEEWQEGSAEVQQCHPETESPYTPVGLRFPSGLTFEGWLAFGRRLDRIANASLWWLGDWCAYGEERYGRKYEDAVAVTGFDYQTLRNYAWVARRFDLSRRRDNLSFAHHAEVAALPEVEREEWLDRSTENGWSRNKLRAQLREKRTGSTTAPATTRLEYVRLGADAQRVEFWRKAAEASRLELPEWLAAVADAAASSRQPSIPAA